MSATTSNTSDNKDVFYEAVKTTFKNWTAFQLALAHNFGGSDTKEKAEWFLNATYEWIMENNDLEDDELEDFFIDTMNTEFNSILEDESSLQLARLLLKYNKMFRTGQINELKEDLNKRFASKSSSSNSTVNSSIKQSVNNDGESSSEESDDQDDNEEEDEEKNSEMNVDAESENKPKSKLDEKEKDDFQMVEEGWTFVSKSGKHIAK